MRVLMSDTASAPSAYTARAMSAMLGCNCFIDIPAGSGPLENGSEVEVVVL